MTARYSWRKGNAYDGLRRLPESYVLRHGGVDLAIAQIHHDGPLFFWYGDGVNTAFRPDTLEAVKAEAIAHFKARAAAP